MSLTERLALAEAERRGEPVVLNLTETPGPDSPAASPESGLPFPCRQCGGHGFLDRIDLGARRQHEHCRHCGHRWSRPI